MAQTSGMVLHSWEDTAVLLLGPSKRHSLDNTVCRELNEVPTMKQPAHSYAQLLSLELAVAPTRGAIGKSGSCSNNSKSWKALWHITTLAEFEKHCLRNANSNFKIVLATFEDVVKIVWIYLQSSVHMSSSNVHVKKGKCWGQSFSPPPTFF